jgi:hypothetical protein
MDECRLTGGQSKLGAFDHCTGNKLTRQICDGPRFSVDAPIIGLVVRTGVEVEVKNGKNSLRGCSIAVRKSSILQKLSQLFDGDFLYQELLPAIRFSSNLRHV